MELTERPTQHEIIVARTEWHVTVKEAQEIPTLADLEFPCCLQIGEHAQGCPGRLMI